MCIRDSGKGAECFLNGLALTCDHQHLDNHIITNHNAPNCTSSQNFKSVLNDSSSGVFNGRTIVSQGAEKTDSNQSNKNILLSSRNIKKAKVVLASELNTYDVVSANKMMILESSVNEIEQNL